MVALGSGDGSGFQPAALSHRPDYLETHMRWVLGTADNQKYYFLSNAQAFRHLSGGAIGEKQNGFNRSVFTREHGLAEAQFIDELYRWVRST